MYDRISKIVAQLEKCDYVTRDQLHDLKMNAAFIELKKIAESEITVFIPVSNTDLTEGRGNNIYLSHCKLKATAERLGIKKYVQGTDCPVSESVSFLIAGNRYGEIKGLEHATKEDEYIENARNKKAELLQKYNISEDDAKVLSMKF